MTVDIAKLKALAEAANAVTGAVNVEMTISSEDGPNQTEIDAVTAFMGAATPAAVLDLLAENERLKADLEQAQLIGRISCNFDGYKAVLDERDQLKAKLVYAYNRGYMAGHHDTAEGQFTDIHQSDMRTYHDDVVAEIAAEPE